MHPTPEQLENQRQILHFLESMGSYSPAISSITLIVIAVALIVLGLVATVTAVVIAFYIRRYTGRRIYFVARDNLIAEFQETAAIRDRLSDDAQRAEVEVAIVNFGKEGYAALTADQKWIVNAFDRLCAVLRKPRLAERDILTHGGRSFSRFAQRRLLEESIFYAAWVRHIRASDVLARRAALSIPSMETALLWRDLGRRVLTSVPALGSFVDLAKARFTGETAANPVRRDDSAQAVSMETAYAAKKKDIRIAYALWLVLGLLGAHRFYLSRPLTACGIPALAIASFYLPSFSSVLIMATGLWMVVDAVLIPIMVRDYNNDLIEALDSRFI